MSGSSSSSSSASTSDGSSRRRDTSGGGVLDSLSRYWNSYLGQLREHPVRTKALTGAVLAAASDIASQKLLGVAWRNLNTTSTRNQVLFAFLVRGPAIHYWLEFLDKTFRRFGIAHRTAQEEKENGGPTVTTLLLKVLVDQAVFSPALMLVYLHAIGLLERKPLPVIQANISKSFVPIMMNNYRVWPLVALINFKLIPPQLRVLFGNIVGFFWLMYLIVSAGRPAAATPAPTTALQPAK